MANVSFKRGTFSDYKRISSPDFNTLYFVDDIGKIYKGSVDVTKSITLVNNDQYVAIKNGSASDIPEGMMYLNSENLKILVRNKYTSAGVAHDEIKEIYPGYYDNISGSAVGDAESVVTGRQVSSFVTPIVNQLRDLVTILPVQTLSQDNTVLVSSQDETSPIGDSGYTIGGSQIVGASGTLATEEAVTAAVEDSATKWSHFD